VFDLKNVELSDELHARIESRIKGKSEFDSVSGYVEVALTRLLDRLERSTGTQRKVDEEKVKGRLRALGYID